MLIMMLFGRSVWLVEYPDYVENNKDRLAKAIFRVGNLEDIETMKEGTKLYSQIFKFYYMKIKDLPEGTELKGLKVKTRRGVIGYYHQGGHCVVFLSPDNVVIDNIITEGKTNETCRLFPQVVEKDEDVLDWDVIDNEVVKTNCDVLTNHRHTINFDVPEFNP